MKKNIFSIAFSIVVMCIGMACAQSESKTTSSTNTSSSANVVKSNGEDIHWMSWADAIEANKKEPRKFIVDTYTSWCGWCKKMDATTFKHPDIVKYVNKKYYAVKFNAEQMEDIDFNGKTYKHVGGEGRSGYHELAYALMNGRMSYPTIIFLDEKLENLSPVPGFMKASQIDPILKFFGEEHYKSTQWNTFTTTYKTNVTD